MKTKKTMLVVMLAVAIVSAIACLVILNRPTAPPKQEVALTHHASQPAVIVTEAPPPMVQPPEEKITEPAQAESTQPPVQPKPKPQTTTAQNQKANEPRQDPLARVALSLVGVDPVAEEYWMEAIFNPNLSDQEREDLMEDLNEEGLSDPRHPTPEDLVVIWNRISPIEDALLYADGFMQEHLMEAYKDLLNLLNGVGPR